MLGKQHVVMVHYIANAAVFLQYGRMRFFIDGDVSAVFVVLVSINHILAHREEKQQEPGVYYN